MIKLDATDHQILAVLRADGRVSMLDLADRVGLSPTPCGRRVKRMEQAGVIRGYHASVDRAVLGQSVGALISVRLTRHGTEGPQQFLSAVAKRAEVTECLLVAGNVDYILRVMVEDLEALARFIHDVLQKVSTVVETSTMVILDDAS